MTANRLPASWMNALDPAAGARRSRWTAAPAGAPRCLYISRRSRPSSGQTVTVPSSFRRGELPRRLRAPFARNVIPGAHAADRARGCARFLVMNRRTFLWGLTLGALVNPFGVEAQPAARVWQIAFLGAESPSTNRHFLDAFGLGMRERGYVEGQNVI